MQNDSKARTFAYRLLIFSVFFLYVILVASRNLHIAEKTTLQGLGVFGSYTDLAATHEYYYYAYAIMQILLCFFIIKLNVKVFLTISVSISALLTILVAFTTNIGQQWVIFIVMGFCQAGVWGLAIKILGQYLPEKMLVSANLFMTAGPTAGSVLSYAVAAIFGEVWTIPFVLFGLLLLFAVALFFYSATLVSKFPRHIQIEKISTSTPKENDQDNDFVHLNNKKRVVWFFILSAFTGLLLTGIYFAINNVLDLFLKQVGGFDNTTAKWFTVLSPIVTLVGPFLMVKACERYKNLIAVCLVVTLTGMVFLLLLLFIFEVNIYLSLVLFLIFLILSNGARSVTLSIAPLKMRDKIDTGLYATVVNVPSSLVAGLGPKIFTKIVDNPLLTISQNWTNAFIFGSIWAVVLALSLCSFIFIIKCLHKIDKQKT